MTTVSLSISVLCAMAHRIFLDQIMRALQTNLGLLGDKLYIKHTTMLHQEGVGMLVLFLPLAHC